MSDVLSMVVIFVILVLAWGTARLSILHPDINIFGSSMNSSALNKWIYAPSFQIFGELFMESVGVAEKESEYHYMFVQHVFVFFNKF